MRNKILLTIFTASFLAGCTSAQPSLQSSTSPQPSTTSSPTPQMITGSILTLLGGTNKECTWTGSVEGYDIEGVVYTSDQKFRAEASTKMSIIPVTSYAVGDGSTITAWASLGITEKMTFSYADVQKVLSQSSNNPVIKELATDHTFTCTPWTPDPTAFTTPQ